MKRFLLTLTAISVLTGFANAGLTGTHSGKITNIYANQNGNYLFRVTNLDGSTSTTLYDLWIPTSAVGSKNMLSVVRRVAEWHQGLVRRRRLDLYHGSGHGYLGDPVNRHATGLTAGILLLGGAAGTATAQIFTPGNPAVVYTKAQLDNIPCVHKTLFNKPLVIDASLSFMKQYSLDQVRVLWTSPWGLDLYDFNTLSRGDFLNTREYEAQHDQISGALPSEWYPAGERTGGGRWTLNKNYSGSATADVDGFIQNIYKISDVEWLGFIHIERSDQNMAQPTVVDRLYAIGLAYSKDTGRTWTYAGDIIRPGYDKLGDKDNAGYQYLSNIGGIPYTVVKDAGSDYFYVYFNEYALTPASPTVPSSHQYTAVARAKVSDAVADAKAGSISHPWKKYRPSAGGNWAESGLTGSGFAVLPSTMDDMNAGFYDMHTRAAFSPFLQRHLLLANAVEWEGGVGGRLYRRLVMFTSMNGLDWARKKVVDESYGDVAPDFKPGYNVTYGSFVSTSGASDDYHQVGRDFSLIYPRQYKADYTNADLISLPITAVPDLTPSYNALFN